MKKISETLKNVRLPYCSAVIVAGGSSTRFGTDKLFAEIGGVPVLGSLFSILSSLVSLALFVLAIIGIVNACSGKAKELPLVGTFRILK